MWSKGLTYWVSALLGIMVSMPLRLINMRGEFALAT